jgi:4-nitrophenyl phosphatase/phosphoglycolate phosphatase
VYIIGQEGIQEELDLLGIEHIGGPSFANVPFKLGSDAKVEQDRDVAAVVVGFDQHINYYKIQYAQLCINENEGCKFIATNQDENGHLNGNQIWAGTGSMVGAVRGCTGREPIIVGKPSSLMIDYLVSKYKFDRSRMCMVGDRLDTDVLFGLENGMKTILTLSGVTTKQQLFRAENKIVPDYYVESIDDLFP